MIRFCKVVFLPQTVLAMTGKHNIVLGLQIVISRESHLLAKVQTVGVRIL